LINHWSIENETERVHWRDEIYKENIHGISLIREIAIEVWRGS